VDVADVPKRKRNWESPAFVINYLSLSLAPVLGIVANGYDVLLGGFDKVRSIHLPWVVAFTSLICERGKRYQNVNADII
jgi:hypothetical protein